MEEMRDERREKEGAIGGTCDSLGGEGAVKAEVGTEQGLKRQQMSNKGGVYNRPGQTREDLTHKKHQG